MDQRTPPNETATELADDLLRGADEIAELIFGDLSPANSSKNGDVAPLN